MFSIIKAYRIRSGYRVFQVWWIGQHGLFDDLF